MLLSTEHLQLKHAPVRKLRKRFEGPFFVTKRVGPVAYELELPQTWHLHPVFHTSFLRPFRTSEWSTKTQAALDDLELEEDDRSYEVERLLRWRWRGPSGRRHREYLVLWAGYSVDDASWMPANNFDYPEELQNMIDRDNPVEDIAMI